jgi:hypothetical protein
MMNAQGEYAAPPPLLGKNSYEAVPVSVTAFDYSPIAMEPQ